MAPDAILRDVSFDDHFLDRHDGHRNSAESQRTDAHYAQLASGTA